MTRWILVTMLLVIGFHSIGCEDRETTKIETPGGTVKIDKK